jgi:hypothetical protein
MVSGISVWTVVAEVCKEMLLTKYQNTQHHKPEGYNLYMQDSPYLTFPVRSNLHWSLVWNKRVVTIK